MEKDTDYNIPFIYVKNSYYFNLQVEAQVSRF